ncbi:hypothetical protein [Pseudoalteromonas luteoviolacea]|uniref:Uncharacterized protein n=1 Tax=Pseudoalteromonas luteoviolacea (strain 2ta16) TaxID=1353533 RepID=V4HZQ0_PSEL2|nr:hypothetical protein [Pseudoalteromonas luteoviolacea]ESP93444.1 hypothetical protein PL2TA16_03297 [Pseudoalteromonas luteoviolacea 2ta16]KZN43919.1 hypothetical protein N483_08340 [Pseudoalteromonas luteoviolacea NCIMB 1944]
METKNLMKLALLSLPMMIAAPANAHKEQGIIDTNTQQELVANITLNLDCQAHPEALQRAVSFNYLAQTVKFVVSGECAGPIEIKNSRFEIINDAGRTGSIRVKQDQEHVQQSAVLVQSGSVVLSNINIDVPNDMPAVELKANSVGQLKHVTTNAKSASEDSFQQFLVTDNSTAYFESFSGNSVGVYGSSYAEFTKATDQIELKVFDTSSAKSNDKNHFSSVQVAGNGYFLADNQSNINLLMVWSKGAAEINNKSRVGEIMMGGQTHFAAYKESTIAGPYGIWGNVVFELEHSTAYNWKAVDKPYSIIIGNNANVNGKFYPGWSWTGQAK